MVVIGCVKFLTTLGICGLFVRETSLEEVINNQEIQDGDTTKDVCHFETEHLRCRNNAVILVKSATYGRMRIGRCIKSEEVAAHKSVVGDDPRYLGCSVDVLPVLDQKCSGKSDCEFRLSDIPEDKYQPCFPGLKMYLELSNSCINIVDEKRSCAVVASKIPTNIMISLDVHAQCGSDVQPWVITSATGQRIALKLLEIGLSNSELDKKYGRNFCHDFGTIRETSFNRNSSICFSGTREKDLYFSSGNKLEISFTSLDRLPSNERNRRLVLEIRAVGCSDIVPPEDSWLQRKDDRIIIGCYSNRQIWHLSCEQGRWTGVFGNCTANAHLDAVPVSEIAVSGSALSNKAQVLAIVAISGFTLAICLTIVCVGAVYLHRFYGRYRAKDYSTLDCGNNSVKRETFHPGTTIKQIRGDLIVDENPTQVIQHIPSYYVHAEQNLDN